MKKKMIKDLKIVIQFTLKSWLTVTVKVPAYTIHIHCIHFAFLYQLQTM